MSWLLKDIRKQIEEPARDVRRAARPRAGHLRRIPNAPVSAANEAYRDPTRQALDEAVLVELLGLRARYSTRSPCSVCSGARNPPCTAARPRGRDPAAVPPRPPAAAPLCRIAARNEAAGYATRERWAES